MHSAPSLSSNDMNAHVWAYTRIIWPTDGRTDGRTDTNGRVHLAALFVCAPYERNRPRPVPHAQYFHSIWQNASFSIAPHLRGNPLVSGGRRSLVCRTRANTILSGSLLSARDICALAGAYTHTSLRRRTFPQKTLYAAPAYIKPPPPTTASTSLARTQKI